ncbi:hypothetical protein [Thiothrix unzii]|jgi:hypothetical protein|uniref:Uncharacterized protein n=1 Tax=Thiothrix unzii TaxID=111769 RepID=A0A975F6K8_9GAMM|nr:hypothetical protein [Thiothrix unzii]QTR51901.1 hypothetical protein J9260_00035 [Thiothrix unzii]
MHTHDSNLRPSVREHFTDNHATPPRNTAVSTPNHPAPVDWALFFHVVVRLLAVTALLYIAYCIFTYFQLFGVSAIALSGQFALALFFTYAVLTGYDDAETLLICLGMFLLVGMF